MGLYNIKGDNSPGKYRNLSFYLNVQKLHLLEMNYDLLVLFFMSYTGFISNAIEIRLPLFLKFLALCGK